MKKGNSRVNLNALENRARRRMANRDQVTIVNTPGAKSISKESQDMDSPRFKVVEVTFPGRSPIQISGGDALIPLQLSLLKALIPLFEEKGDITKKEFLEWGEKFERGFLDLKDGRGNFKEWQKKFLPWGKPFNNRPKIWLLLPDNKSPYICQVFPDRSIEKDFYLFSGNFRDIINQIMLFWALKDSNNSGEGSERSSKPGRSIAGHPLVILRFKEESPPGEKKPLYLEKSFRLMTKSDNPDSKFSMISKSEIEILAKRIITTFSDPFLWDYGEKCLSYKGEKARAQGLDGWAYCKSQSDGIALFEKIAKCANIELDRKLFRFSEAVDPGAFPQTAKEFTLLGKQEKAPIHRKRCKARFYDAKIHLPFSRQTIPLCKGSLLLV